MQKVQLVIVVYPGENSLGHNQSRQDLSITTKWVPKGTPHKHLSDICCSVWLHSCLPCQLPLPYELYVSWIANNTPSF